jgi:hypothetical protein
MTPPATSAEQMMIMAKNRGLLWKSRHAVNGKMGT